MIKTPRPQLLQKTAATVTTETMKTKEAERINGEDATTEGKTLEGAATYINAKNQSSLEPPTD